MPTDGLHGALLGDPLALYPALAALVLASVSLAAGLLRGDALALARPVPVAWLLVVLAATAGIGLAAGVAPAPWPDVLVGGARFPAYLFALAYGPVPGLVAAALIAAWVPLPHASEWGAWLLGLEVAVIGWLAVWPSPRRSRWTGPLYAPLTYTLAWGTLGLAALALDRGAVDLALLVQQHALVPAGVLAVAIALALVGPRSYERAFTASRIAPVDAGPAGRHGRGGTAPGANEGPPNVDVPPPLERPRRRRGPLTPVPGAGGGGPRREPR